MRWSRRKSGAAVDKREQLRALMAAGGWKPAAVASMLGRGVQTVYSWLTRPERIPPDVLRILTLELRIRELEGGLYAMMDDLVLLRPQAD